MAHGVDSNPIWSWTLDLLIVSLASYCYATVLPVCFHVSPCVYVCEFLCVIVYVCLFVCLSGRWVSSATLRSMIMKFPVTCSWTFGRRCSVKWWSSALSSALSLAFRLSSSRAVPASIHFYVLRSVSLYLSVSVCMTGCLSVYMVKFHNH